MARPRLDPARRTITTDTGRRTVDIPVDGAGRLRRVATLDRSAITRAEDDDNPIGFVGHAALFSEETWIGSRSWGFAEIIAPGAFAKSIRESDVRMLINHDSNLILARNTAGSLRLAEDAIGLAVDADMAPTSYGRDLAISLERGDITQMSFAFSMVTYEWTIREDGTELLTHKEVELWDVSPVTYPAYEGTDAGLRGDLLAVARSSGFGDVAIGELAKRLASPDPELIDTLRMLARAQGLDSPPADTTGNGSPPADTTGERTTNPTSVAHLRQRHALSALRS